MNKRNLVLMLMLVFLLSNVSGLGVAPARTTIDFEPGLQMEVPFEVINSVGEDIDIIMVPDGELAEFISISSSESFISGELEKSGYTYTLNLPNELEPGLHVGEIFILQVPKSGGSIGSSVLATLAVVSQVYVYVPYPGKFANADLVIYNANQGEDVKFVFPVVSAGEFDLISVRANVDIFNKLNEKVDSFDTRSISILSGEKKEIVYDWTADVPIGEYRAAATLIYDEGTISLEKVFSVGSLELELESINVASFSLGEIAKLEMLVANKWSEPISGAHIETKIKNDEGDTVLSFKSSSYEVDTLSKEVFVSYWDTAGVIEGTYDAEVVINYADKTSNNNLKFKVSQNELVVLGLGYVISSGEDGEGLDTIIIVLITVIVLLVMVNLLWFFIIRKRLK